MGIFRRFRFALVMAALLMGALAFFSFNAGQEPSGTLAGRMLMEVVGPVQSAVTWVSDTIDRTVRHYFLLVRAARENEDLHRQVALMRQQLADLEEYRRENQRLRRLLALDERFEHPVAAAQVVGTDPTGHFRTVIINKGASGGVGQLMPVVAADGVAGRVIWASPHFAKVLLLTDPNSGVDVLVQRSRARGVVEGAGEGRLRLKYVLHTDDVVPGDQLVTSGAAGVYPKGLLVGVVTSTHQERPGVFLDVEAEPSVDFARLEEVAVVLKKPEFAP